MGLGALPGTPNGAVAKLATSHSKHHWVKWAVREESLWEGQWVRDADQLEQFCFKATQGKGHFSLHLSN